MAGDHEEQQARVEEARKPEQKHDCSDCSFCQWCSDDRCRLCRGEVRRPACKLSLAEQVLRYEAVNRRR